MSNLAKAWDVLYKQQLDKANLEQNKLKQEEGE